MKWTILKAATEFGVSRETIRRGLSTNGVKSKEEYTTREIHGAISGDLKAARTREALANAIAAERENRIAEGELMETQEVVEFYTQALLPIRQRLLALPNECATRVNPTDPQFAREALQRWVDDALPMIRDGLPKPKGKKR